MVMEQSLELDPFRHPEGGLPCMAHVLRKWCGQSRPLGRHPRRVPQPCSGLLRRGSVLRRTEVKSATPVRVECLSRTKYIST